MTNKSLAEKAGFAASSIGKGKKQGSSPSADTAVKIAKILNVTVEYLVTGETSSQQEENGVNLHKFHKYAKTLDELELIPEKFRKSILNMISEISKED